ncbi:hypothetical protein OG2516_00140 [Oceanicola granulosus HTCC2516]|uniref:Uncharacterized protein n=1 Tax=Oceanicola granulosus (strain ATCC BAA-861 / DSM 15982 / KCTC 12143 / HTCC2516) TaxID=314256 RepID=Q2CDW3_OCEGH|nr:hypothetical protein [Oceanicola granulosus]EAR50865.1 hypothetical protein OG2516_00140 [Oceanicola granulosus HTCC2516]
MRDENDPKGLIGEAYRMKGIGRAECRSIFLDWALSLTDGRSPEQAIPELLARHEEGDETHPMTETLREGLAAPPRPTRRGGREGRRS